jgi:hypothetical protein
MEIRVTSRFFNKGLDKSGEFGYGKLDESKGVRPVAHG